MRRLTDTRGLAIGDVVLVHQQCTDKQGKEYVWRWFGLVREPGRTRVGVLRVGAEPKDESRIIQSSGNRYAIYHLDDDTRWPDGVHAFRTRAILRGDIDIS